MDSPWLKIPLADYEAHIGSPSVDQASLLADIFSTQLRRFRPASVAVIGCAGGNGLEHIDPQATPRVVGVDVNPEYLAATKRRHSAAYRDLVLCNADIAGEALQIEPVDLCYAALIFEHVAVAAALGNLRALCRQSGHLIAVLQLPSSSSAMITATPIPSILRLASVMRLVDPLDLAQMARGAGFALLESTRVASRAGKEFAIQIYQ
jgi:SAM-dependent methyltransferase